MADVTEINLWPCHPNTLDWSEDGIVAQSSNLHVELLFFNLDSFESEIEQAEWRHLSIQAPWFTQQELPPKEPAPSETFSVGEEISESYPVRISWSPAGLAKHRRCALGVLTTNLVFSIWAANGKPEEETSWDRRLMINKTLEDYICTNVSTVKSHLTSDPDEKIRLWKRVRAFAWAPAMRRDQPVNTIGTQLSWGPQLVAVANDDNHVIILAINSPTSSQGADDDWNAKILGTPLAITPDSDSIFESTGIFDETMKQQRHISHIAWSPWILRGDSFHSVLAYATNEDVRARVVTYSGQAIDIADEIVYPNIELRFTGPMKWSPKVGPDDSLTLALFTNSELICLTVSPSNASILNRASHHLDGRWDEISGVSWHHSTESSVEIHFASFQAGFKSPTAAAKASPNQISALPTPNWQQHIAESARLYSEEFNLGGHSKAKIWGLVNSPLGEFIASTHTLHPTDMMEYGQPADRSLTIAIHPVRSYDGQHDWLVPSSSYASAEAILYSTKKWLENKIEKVQDMPSYIEPLVEKLMQTFGNPSHDHEIAKTASYKATDLNTLVPLFKQNAFLIPETLRDRYTVLLSSVCNPSATLTLERTLIAYRLTEELIKLSPYLSKPDSFSYEILTSHRNLRAFVSRLIQNSENAEGAPDDTTAAAQNPPDYIFGDETCDFCDAQIPFTDPTQATCMNGHKYPRCRLTFLTIQNPGISKYCAICNSVFFSDEYVFEQETVTPTPSVQDLGEARCESRNDNGSDVEISVVNPDSSAKQGAKANAKPGVDVRSEASGRKRDLPVTLTRVLFLACDACIYCGGKFVG
ncbi:hypothetical protein BS50DRAFT_498136 [Corynespora cassiicola Philippines]|uniref:Transcription factor IIIC 90kDa subunit N-terminal domain-containing protein n=1 Tax=Corynespora cassiicola Philippines TaxID=1448308 RepID=A0A2T2NG47_CORCC|nr:hypothetical protein BS50DRAFT_498136 [Corynespora cassiicola Philippines]